jgi:hypothetical protein
MKMWPYSSAEEVKFNVMENKICFNNTAMQIISTQSLLLKFKKTVNSLCLYFIISRDEYKYFFVNLWFV